MTRGVGQVAAGKPVAIFLQGEYGIGKSSIANYVQFLAERQNGLHGIHAPLGSAANLDDVGAAILEATIRSGAFDPRKSEKVREFFSKYIGEQSLFGVTVHAEALKRDAPAIASGLLPFLRQVVSRLADTGVKGIFLVLDEINGITSNPKFAHFIKEIVDTNALAREPLPLLLLVCGVEERRREMIRRHQPVDRVFDVVEVETMSPPEMSQFFTKAFESIHVKVGPDAIRQMTEYSAGFPKIMHLVGDAAFWSDRDGVIDSDDALDAVIAAADEVGKKYFDQQVLSVLRSDDYRSILKKIAGTGLDMTFRRADVAKGLTDSENRKFNNFLQKMKRLNVLRPGDVQGEYVFNVRMVRLYIWLGSRRTKRGRTTA
ncbi:MAG: ATP-binding protein [Acidobacteria bacterium]|nr:ATP-binding protein [Acidobacteriota bacterium]